jgi:hypothetical protein
MVCDGDQTAVGSSWSVTALNGSSVVTSTDGLLLSVVISLVSDSGASQVVAAAASSVVMS